MDAHPRRPQIYPKGSRTVPERPLSPADLAGRLASYETLVDISRMLLVSVTPDELFERISSELNRLVPVDALTIYRVDEVNREIVPVHARDQWADEIMAAPLRLGEGLTGWVVEHREAANVTAAERDPRIAVVPGTPSDEPEAIVVRAARRPRPADRRAQHVPAGRGRGVHRRRSSSSCASSPTWRRSRSTTPRTGSGSCTRPRPTGSPACTTTASSTSGCATSSSGRSATAARCR